ncbi:hypothetical protein CsatA_017012 [Cannabis sativa]
MLFASFRYMTLKAQPTKKSKKFKNLRFILRLLLKLLYCISKLLKTTQNTILRVNNRRKKKVKSLKQNPQPSLFRRAIQPHTIHVSAILFSAASPLQTTVRTHPNHLLFRRFDGGWWSLFSREFLHTASGGF